MLQEQFTEEKRQLKELEEKLGVCDGCVESHSGITQIDMV